ncbi:hypothetical protein [Pectobacterium sp. B2J-2]
MNGEVWQVSNAQPFAAQNAGYNQPPNTSFYLGEGMIFLVR